MRVWNPTIPVFITNRCEEERFFLLPKPETKAVILAWLAKALAEHPGIQLHAYVFMSNHFHLLVTDPLGQLADFMCYLQGQMGRAINRDILGERRGHFWSKSYSSIPVLTDADFEERYAYILTNPVKPGLVARAEDSPFVSSYRQSFSELPLTCQWLDRTKRNDKGRGGRAVQDAECVEELEIRLTLPPQWRKLSKSARAARIAGLVKGMERRYGRFRAAEGRSVLGVRRILAQNPFMRPRNSARAPAPTVFCKDRELKETYIEGFKALFGLYREAFDGYVKASRKGRRLLVEWPPGTYPPSVSRPIGAPV
jgi:putative transposase